MWQDPQCELLNALAEKSWLSLRRAAQRRGASKAKEHSLHAELPSQFKVFVTLAAQQCLMATGLVHRVNAGEKVTPAVLLRF